MKCLFLLSCEMSLGLVDSHSSHLEVWGRCRPAEMKQALDRSWQDLLPCPAVGWSFLIPACGAVVVVRHCSTGSHGSAPGAGTVAKMLNISCFDFRLCSTSGSVQSWLCRWALNSYCSFSTQWSIICAKKDVISFTNNLASNETLNCRTRAPWW